MPHNEGSFRPVHVTAPEGSILNCTPPAAVGSRHVIGHFLPSVIFQALAPAMPGRLIAGGADSSWLNIVRGQLPGQRGLVHALDLPGGRHRRAARPRTA